MNNKKRVFLLLMVIGARIDVAPTNVAWDAWCKHEDYGLKQYTRVVWALSLTHHAFMLRMIMSEDFWVMGIS